MRKRGLSNIITSIIIVFVAIFAVSVIWVVINPAFSELNSLDEFFSGFNNPEGEFSIGEEPTPGSVEEGPETSGAPAPPSAPAAPEAPPAPAGVPESGVEVGDWCNGADFDRNGKVDGNDYLIWQNNFLSEVVTQREGDANGDCNVDGEDFLIWQNNFPSGNCKEEQFVWTDFTPSPDTKIVYVSSSDGDDGTGIAYDASQFSDPFNPPGSIKPFKRIDIASEKLRDGKPDWLLLKRGDEWTISSDDDGGFNDWSDKSGRSINERILLSAYGDVSRQRPKLNVESGERGFEVGGDFLHDIAIASIYFNSLARGKEGINSYTDGKNLLIEDVVIEGFGTGIVFYVDNSFANIEMRRSFVIDNGKQSKSQGIFLRNVDGFLLEESIIDRNGYEPDLSASRDEIDPDIFSKGGRDIFSHNIYYQVDSCGLVVKGNIISWASSHGLQARPGGIVEDNLFVRNPLGFSFGHVLGSRDPLPGGVTGWIQRNVILEGNDITNSAPRSVAVELGNIKDAVFTDNIAAHTKRLSSSGGRAIKLYDGSSCCRQNGIGIENIESERNIVFDWDKLGNIDQYGSTNLLDNDGDNIFGFNDPNRDLAGYHASIEKEGTTDAFFEELRRQRRYDWDDRYTAKNINEYIRAGFAVASLN